MAHEVSADFHTARARAAPRRERKPVRRASLAPAAVVEVTPRRLPTQARSRATFEAIVDACGQMLASGPYQALTTNGISERAGVSIGTLYEYFPNREAIVAALCASACQRLVARMEQAIAEAAGMGQFEGVEHLLGAGIEAMRSPENVFDVMLREAPFVLSLPAMIEAREALTAQCHQIRMAAADTLDLPAPETDTWLLSHMLFAAMLEIAGLDVTHAERARYRRELARLTCRMALGRDAAPPA